MQYHQLGHTDIQVSALCLGTMYFGSNNDEETSWKLLDQCIEAGGTFLDTANAYARWTVRSSGSPPVRSRRRVRPA